MRTHPPAPPAAHPGHPVGVGAVRPEGYVYARAPMLRAFARTGDPLESDPLCAYVPPVQ